LADSSGWRKSLDHVPQGGLGVPEAVEWSPQCEGWPCCDGAYPRPLGTDDEEGAEWN